MDLWWVLLVAAAFSLYFLILTGYRLWISIRDLVAAVGKTNALLGELKEFDEVTPSPASAASEQDLVNLLAERRKLLKQRRKRQAERQRRLVNRVREIDIDKRWA